MAVNGEMLQTVFTYTEPGSSPALLNSMQGEILHPLKQVISGLFVCNYNNDIHQVLDCADS